MGRKTITVSEGTYEMLDRNKDEGVTWDKHLTDLQYATDAEEGDVGEVPEGLSRVLEADKSDIEELKDMIESVQSSAETAEERTGKIERQLEGMQR